MNAKLIFTDQTELVAEVNGSCFITDEQPEFPEDLSVVVVQEIEPEPDPDPEVEADAETEEEPAEAETEEEPEADTDEVEEAEETEPEEDVEPEPEPAPLMTKTLYDVIVQECASVDGRYWFALIEKPASQKEKEDLLAELEAQAEAIVELAELIGGQE